MIYDLKELLTKHNLEGRLFAWQDESNKKVKIAKQLLDKHVKNNVLKAGQTVVEASAGSMAAAVSAATMENNISFVAFTFEHIINRLCPNTTVFSPIEDGVLPMLTFQKHAKQYAIENDALYLNQFEDPYHWQIYEELGDGVFAQLNANLDCYIDKAGTAATIRGLAQAARKRFPQIEVFCINNPGIPHIAFLKDFDFRLITPESERFADSVAELKQDLGQMYGMTRLNEGLICIFSALEWLKANPGKTVFTTIGD